MVAMTEVTFMVLVLLELLHPFISSISQLLKLESLSEVKKQIVLNYVTGNIFVLFFQIPKCQISSRPIR